MESRSCDEHYDRPNVHGTQGCAAVASIRLIAAPYRARLCNIPSVEAVPDPASGEGPPFRRKASREGRRTQAGSSRSVLERIDHGVRRAKAAPRLRLDCPSASANTPGRPASVHLRTIVKHVTCSHDAKQDTARQYDERPPCRRTSGSYSNRRAPNTKARVVPG